MKKYRRSHFHLLSIVTILLIVLGCNNGNTNSENDNSICTLFPENDVCEDKPTEKNDNTADDNSINTTEKNDNKTDDNLIDTILKNTPLIKKTKVKKTKVSFFITSEGSVKNTLRNIGDRYIVEKSEATREGFSGGNLGGLAGADAQCTRLAEAAKLFGRTWKAFLTTTDEEAFDRIGRGPWYNIDKVKIADNVAGLKAQNSTAEHLALLKDEKGNNVILQEHDILIGDRTKNCNNWTSDSNSNFCGIITHASRVDIENNKNEWIQDSAHGGTNNPCSVAGIKTNFGGGKFYCFASDTWE